MIDIKTLLEELKQLDMETFEAIEINRRYVYLRCIQRAITNRGYYYRIKHFHKTYYATITIPNDAWTDKNFSSNSNNNQAEAILAAYVAALKEEMKK